MPPVFRRSGCHALCTECLARTFNNEMEGFLPMYSKEYIGFYVWGLCAGSAQYHFPWAGPSEATNSSAGSIA